MDNSLQAILKQGVAKGYFRVSKNFSEIEYVSQNYKDKLSNPEEQVRVGAVEKPLKKENHQPF